FHGNLRHVLHGTVGEFEAIAHLLAPETQIFKLGDQISIDLKKVARKRLALEEVGDLRLDAFVRADDRRDRRGRCDGDEQRVAQAVLANALAQLVPARWIIGSNAPMIHLQCATGSASVRERRVWAVLGSERARGIQCVEINLLLDAARKLAGFRRVKWKSEQEENILQSHDSQADRPPSSIRITGGSDGVEVDVDHAVEKLDGGAHGLRQLFEVEAEPGDVLCKIDRAKIADRGFLPRADFGDFSAKIR